MWLSDRKNQLERQTLNRHPLAAVHQNAAILELLRDFGRILLPEKFHDGTSSDMTLVQCHRFYRVFQEKK